MPPGGLHSSRGWVSPAWTLFASQRARASTKTPRAHVQRLGLCSPRRRTLGRERRSSHFPVRTRSRLRRPWSRSSRCSLTSTLAAVAIKSLAVSSLQSRIRLSRSLNRCTVPSSGTVWSADDFLKRTWLRPAYFVQSDKFVLPVTRNSWHASLVLARFGWGRARRQLGVPVRARVDWLDRWRCSRRPGRRKTSLQAIPWARIATSKNRSISWV